MQKKSQEDYRNAVAQSIINARDDLRVHRNTLTDHAVTLDDHATTLADHATELDSHNTELDDHETRVDTAEGQIDTLEGLPGTCPSLCIVGSNVWFFIIGTDGKMWVKINDVGAYAIAYNGPFNGGVDCYYDGSAYVHVVARGADGIPYHGWIKVSDGERGTLVSIGGDCK